MEFEKNKPTTADDIALAETPHVTLEPAHGDVRPDVTNVPNPARPDNRNFEFETESTADAALSTDSASHHSHHRLALTFTIITVLLFIAILVSIYLLR